MFRAPVGRRFRLLAGMALCACALCACVLAPAAGGSEARPVTRTVLLGRSIEGKPIVAIERGDRTASRKALVVGCIHGNEPAGIAVARRLESLRVPDELDLWVIPSLNPDGVALGTRGNAHGVDLNRNFPWRWRRLRGVHYSGPAPLSERESRIAYLLVLRQRPRVSIWFHQHLDLVDESGGNVAVERRFAALAGLRIARLPREPGSVVSWQNARLPGTTAFVVELPAGRPEPAVAARYARAVLGVARP